MIHQIKELEKQLHQIPSLKSCSYKDPKFKNWEVKTSRTIKKLFGENSQEWIDFSQIHFWYHYAGGAFEKMLKGDYETANFQNGLVQAQLLLQDLVEEGNLGQFSENSILVEGSHGEKKIFISHSSKDNLIGQEIINLLQLIGINHEKIFYTSSAGYGIPLGENWVQTLKREISGGSFVITLLTENYFQSEICLCELGAAWVLSKKHIPILVPPLSFKEVNEIISTSQGFDITNSVNWSSLKRLLEKDFELTPLPEDKWEPQRDAILARIKQLSES